MSGEKWKWPGDPFRCSYWFASELYDGIQCGAPVVRKINGKPYCDHHPYKPTPKGYECQFTGGEPCPCGASPKSCPADRDIR